MVTAVILLTLAVSVGGRLLISYGEAEGKEMDMEHVSDVEDSMLNMRGSMYTLLGAHDTRTTIVNRVSLGTFGNPYLAVARSSGTMVVDQSQDEFSITVLMGPSGSETMLDTVSGSMVYVGDLYYFEDHDYHFEGGAIIVDEGGFREMSSWPSIELVETPSGHGIYLSFYGFGSNRLSISGIESIIMEVQLESFTARSIQLTGQSVTIRVNSFAEEVWKGYFEDLMSQGGMVNGIDYMISDPTDWTDVDDYLQIEIRNLQFLDLDMGVMGVSL
jgi:hypothetical protein